MSAPPSPELAIAITSIGRPELRDLLGSLAASTATPVVVAIANQSGRLLDLAAADYPFPLIVVNSTGGISRGRNDAVGALAGAGDVLGFPNDDSRYGSELVRQVRVAFRDAPETAAVACRLDEPQGPRFALPPAGTALTRRTVWQAIEPATFVSRAAFERVGGFSLDLGSGAASSWGSGEGTDLLLRIMRDGGRVISRADLYVLGIGERRTLDDDEYVGKHRAYARGTGYVYHLHGYPLASRLRTLAGPVARVTRLDDRLSLSLRLARARVLGRAEGLTGRSLERGGLGRRLHP